MFRITELAHDAVVNTPTFVVSLRRSEYLKNGKKPTREQRRIISKNNLDPHEWLVCKALPDELEIVNKTTNELLRISNVLR